MEGNADGIFFRVDDFGEPWAEPTVPVVFQHGLGLTGEAWQPWLGVLGRPAIRIDLRGHGRSRGAWQEERYPIDRFSDDVLAVLDAVGADACHFVGESFGGTIGLHLAAAHPARVRSASVLSTGFRGQSITNVAHWPALVVEEGGVERWSQEINAGRFDLERVDRALLEWVHARQCATDPRAIAGVVECLLGVDLEDELRGLEVPLLTLTGVASPFVDLRSPKALRELVPLAETAFLRDGRHGIFLSHWRQCAAAVGAFVDRAGQGGAQTNATY